MSADLSEMVAAYRRALGLTQAQLAERWGMSVHTVRAIEIGRPTTHAKALCDLLSIALRAS